MTDLVAFVRARLDDDEAAAHDAWPSPWLLDDEEYGIVSPEEDSAVDIASAIVCSSNQQRATNRHIARHQPARLLADVEAKRRILAACQHHESPDTFDLIDDVLRLLAVPYADHSDYQEEWRP